VKIGIKFKKNSAKSIAVCGVFIETFYRAGYLNLKLFMFTKNKKYSN